MSYLLSSRSIKNLEGVDELLKMIAIRGVQESPYDFGIPGLGGRRTSAEQFVLYSSLLSVQACQNIRLHVPAGNIVWVLHR